MSDVTVVTIYRENRVDQPYDVTISALRERFEAWRANEPDWQDCPRARALGYWLSVVENASATDATLRQIHEEV